MRLSTPSQPSTCAPSSLPAGRVEQHLEEQRRGARVVGGVAVLVGIDLAVVHARGGQFGLGHAGTARGHVEHLDHGGALGAPVAADILAAGDRVGGDPAFPVRRAGQHRQHRLPGQEVSGLHRIPGGEDVGRRGTHLRIDHDAATRPDLQASVTGKIHVGTRPGRHHDHVSFD